MDNIQNLPAGPIANLPGSNPLGITSAQPLGSLSPKSNPGIVYQPANKPTAQGSLKVGQQVHNKAIYFAADGSKVSIGPQDTFTNLGAGVVVYDSSGAVVAFLGALELFAPRITTSSNNALSAISATAYSSGLAGSFTNGGVGTGNVVTINNSNSLNANSPLQVETAYVISSHFSIVST